VLDSTFSADPAAEPNSTRRTSLKFFPVTVTRVPPVSAPDDGDTRETVGLGIGAAFADADSADADSADVEAADATVGLAAASPTATAHAIANVSTLRGLTGAP
jgi:hypothetical protein